MPLLTQKLVRTQGNLNRTPSKKIKEIVMGNVIDIKTRKEYRPSKIAEAGERSGIEFHRLQEEGELKAQQYCDFIKQIDEEQARIDVYLTELEDLMIRKGYMVPPPQLRLL
jgi:hypothetical protein